LSGRDSAPTAASPDRVQVERLITGAISAAFAIGEHEIKADSFLLTGAKAFSSFSLLELILRLEDVFQIEIPDDQLDRDRFNTLASIADYVEQRIAESEAG